MAKGTPYKRYTPKFKQRVVEAVRSEGLSYTEAAKRYDISTHKLIQKWENIYLSEGPEGLSVERRGRGRIGQSVKSPDGQEDLLEELKRLRAENDYLKKLHALVMEDERRLRKRRR